jgi:hypothetical protein
MSDADVSAFAPFAFLRFFFPVSSFSLSAAGKLGVNLAFASTLTVTWISGRLGRLREMGGGLGGRLAFDESTRLLRELVLVGVGAGADAGVLGKPCGGLLVKVLDVDADLDVSAGWDLGFDLEEEASANFDVFARRFGVDFALDGPGRGLARGAGSVMGDAAQPDMGGLVGRGCGGRRDKLAGYRSCCWEVEGGCVCAWGTSSMRVMNRWRVRAKNKVMISVSSG